MRWFFFIIIYTLIDLYALQAIRTLTKNFWITGSLFISLFSDHRFIIFFIKFK